MRPEASRQSSLASSAMRQTSSLASPSKSDQARESLIRMATQVTSGTGVKSGYLQLSAGNQQLSTRWMGANAGTQRAVAEVRRLVSEAYGDVPGAKEALDRYLAASGDRIGTRSFVKLVKALESASGQAPTQALARVDEGEARLETAHLSPGLRLLQIRDEATGLINQAKNLGRDSGPPALRTAWDLSALGGELSLLKDSLNADQMPQANALAEQISEKVQQSAPGLADQFGQAFERGAEGTIALIAGGQESPGLTDETRLLCSQALLQHYTAGGQAGRQACEGFVKSIHFDRLLVQAQKQAEAGDGVAMQLRDALNALADTLGVHSAALSSAEVAKTLAAVPQSMQQAYFEAFDRFTEKALTPGPEGKVAAWREVQAAGMEIFKATNCRSQDDRLAMSGALIFKATQSLSMSKMALVLMALQDQETLRTLMVASSLSRAVAKQLDAGRVRLGLPFVGEHLLNNLASNIELDEETGLARLVEGLRARVRGLPGPMPGLETPAELVAPPQMRNVDAATAEAVRRDLPEMTMHELVMRAQITDSEPFTKLDSARQASYLHAKEVIDALDDIDLPLTDRQEALLARVLDHPSAQRQTDPRVRDAFITAITAKAAELLEAMEKQGRMLSPQELFGILTSSQPNEQEGQQLVGDLAGVIAARMPSNTA